jgi:hypothetical protein
MGKSQRGWVTAVALLATGCAADLRPHRSDAGEPDAGETDAGVPHVITSDGGSGSLRSVVDATSSEVWIYFDFERGREVAAEAPEWDLGIQRFKLKSNGGMSGDGGVSVARLPGADFEALTQAPPADAGYLVDAPDGPDEGITEDLAFLEGDGWFEYDPKYHTLKPRPVVFVVHTVEGGYFKVAILGFYDSVGTSGYLSFRWAPVSPP